MNAEKNNNLFDSLWKNVQLFFDTLEDNNLSQSEELLSKIKKNIKDFTKVALIRNLERTDDPKYSAKSRSNQKNITIETQNFYPNILDTTKSDVLEKRFISKATAWKYATTIDALEKILSKKRTEESDRNEIVMNHSYKDILESLWIRSVSLSNPILNFNNQNNTFECNRIWLLIYTLIFQNHTLKIYWNETEAYIYDQTIDKTIVCWNTSGYETYIAEWKKDLYDISEIGKDHISDSFMVIPFNSLQERESAIKKALLPQDKEEKGTQTVKADSHDDINKEIKEEKSDSIVAEEKNTPNSDIQESNPIEINNEDKQNIISSEFPNFYKDWKLNYATFKNALETKHWITLPNKLSSLNSIFGRNPYIFNPQYSVAILQWDKEKIRNFEKTMRDKRYEESKSPESNKIRESFSVYFWLQTEEEKKIFKKDHPELFQNLWNKAQKLWGLPIWQENYIQALLEENPGKCFKLAEQEYTTKIWKGHPYSKLVRDCIEQYKKQWGKGEDICAYMKHLASWKKADTYQVKPSTSDLTTKDKIIHTRKTTGNLTKDDIREIFRDKETGKVKPNEIGYKKYLKDHPEVQNQLPKSIYWFIEYFKDIDPYANNIISSIDYLQALIDSDSTNAASKRIQYCQKKIEESHKPETQKMLMFIWRYLQKSWDKSFGEWITYAKSTTIDHIMKAHPDMKRVLNNPLSIVSYCITTPNVNFNQLSTNSLKDILKPKIDEIAKISPDIYNIAFMV